MDIKLILGILYTEACGVWPANDWSAYNRLNAWLAPLDAEFMALDLFSPGCLI